MKTYTEEELYEKIHEAEREAYAYVRTFKTPERRTWAINGIGYMAHYLEKSLFREKHQGSAINDPPIEDGPKPLP